MKSTRMYFNVWVILLVLLGFAATAVQAADESAEMTVYDENAYTEFVETKMKELDALYLQFCDTCGSEPADAALARQKFLISVRELMQHMNARFDKLEPKAGAALSPTETLVSVHALTMLVDILAATQLEHMAKHPYIE
jgi:hypothetical protein